MNKAVIIRKLAGQVIPLPYLEAALKECPTCFGLAVQYKDGDEDILETTAEARTIAAADMHQKMEELKDSTVVIHLGNFTKDFDPADDLQPYTFQEAVEGEDPRDIVAVFAEGDFPNYAKVDEGHIDEYNLWEKFVFPTMLEKFQASAGDLSDFFNRLSSSQFEQAIMNTVAHRAAVVIVPLFGDIIAFGRNDLGGEFEWGATSNTFGWGKPNILEKAADAAIGAMKKTRSRLASFNSSVAVVPETPRPDPTKKEEAPLPPGVHRTPAPTKKEEPTDVWSKWPGTSAKTHTMTAVPVGLQGNARNRWIRIFLGLPPNDDKALPKGRDVAGFQIPIDNRLIGFAQEDVSTNDEVKDLGEKVKSFKVSGTISKGMAAVAAGDVDPAKMASTTKVEKREPTAAPPKKEDDKRPASDYLPEIKADDKLGSAKLIEEWATNPKRPPALDLQRIEMKWPLATTSYGITWETVSSWSIADAKLLAKKHPDVLALFFIEAKLRANGSVVETPVETPEKKQVEVPPAGPDTPPTQPSTKPAGKRGRLASLTAA